MRILAVTAQICRGCLLSLWLALIFFGLPVLTFLALPLVLAPWMPLRRIGIRVGDGIIFLVAFLLRFGFRLPGGGDCRVLGLDDLQETATCLLVSNHISWADPLIMHAVFGTRLPPRRFLIKQQLSWIPLFGQALVAVGMPALRRTYTQKTASSMTALGFTDSVKSDKNRLRRACEHFDITASSIAIYAEGTRFTPKKHRALRSSFRHLLPPRVGGISMVLQYLPQIKTLYDCTLVYGNRSFTLWDFLCGRVRRMELHLRAVSIPEELQGAEARAKTRLWLDELWRQKDALIEERSRALAD